MTFVSDDILNAFCVKLEETENRQRELQSIRLALEKEISVKKTSISIDRDRCLRYAVCLHCWTDCIHREHFQGENLLPLYKPSEWIQDCSVWNGANLNQNRLKLGKKS